MSRARGEGATRRAALVAFSAVFAVLLAPLAFGAFYGGRDLSYDHVPAFCAARALMALPGTSWIVPYVGGGAPAFTWPGLGLYYPLRWPLFFLQPEAAASLHAALHLAIGAAGATWLARTFRLRPAPAALAGIAFAFTGPSLDLIQKSTFVVGAAWLPFAWAAARRLSARPRASAALPLVIAAAVAACLLRGEPQSAGIALALVGLELGGGLWRFRARALRRVVVGALAALGGLLVGLVPWVPALVEMELGVRSGALDVEAILHAPFGPLEWLAALWPGASTANEQGMPLWKVLADWGELRIMTWSPEPFMGSILVVAALCGVAVRRLRAAALVFGAGLVTSLGAATPVMPLLLKLLPPLALFRYPAKYLVVTALAAVILAVGFAAREARRRRPPFGSSSRAFVAGALVLLTGHLIGLATLLVWGERLDEVAAVDGIALLEGRPLSAVLATAAAQAAGVTAVGVGLWLTGRARWLPALMVAELLLAFTADVPLGAPLDAAHPLAKLTPAGPMVDPPRLCVAPSATGRFGHMRREHGLAMQRIIGQPEMQACDGLASAVAYSSSLDTDIGWSLQEGVDARHPGALHALGCDFAVLKGELPVGARRIPWEDLGVSPRHLQGLNLYRLEDALPHTFVSPAPILVPDGQAVIEAVGASASAVQVAAIVDDPAGSLAGGLPAGDGVTVVERERPSADVAVVTLRGEGGAVVGLRTTFFFGWKATQGGRDLPTVRIAGRHLGAVVEDVGAGPVTFRYQPPRLRLAVGLGGLGALLCLAAALSFRFRRR